MERRRLKWYKVTGPSKSIFWSRVSYLGRWWTLSRGIHRTFGRHRRAPIAERNSRLYTLVVVHTQLRSHGETASSSATQARPTDFTATVTIASFHTTNLFILRLILFLHCSLRIKAGVLSHQGVL